MSLYLPTQTVGRWLGSAALVLSATIFLAGCNNDSYPTDLSYPVRSDPLVTSVPDMTVGIPDRPGQLPLLTIADVKDPLNPLHALEGKQDALLDPTTFTAKQRDEFAATLDKLFGTPAQPKVAGLDDATIGPIIDDLNENNALQAGKLRTVLEDLKKDDANSSLTWDSLNAANFARILQDLKVSDPDMLAKGSALYRAQCLHCHGLTGDGRGPSARWVNPHPRDYRQGVFKFTSSNQDLGERKPRREDLLRILHQGIDGSSMPSFNILSEEQLETLGSYVIHLSLRGQVEYDTMRDLLIMMKNPEAKEQVSSYDIGNELKKRLALIAVVQWRDAQRPSRLIKPENPYPYSQEELVQSVKNGYQAFLSKEGNCYGCHQNFGREVIYSFDAWGTLAKRSNLTQGIYRGGRRPIDLYYRIYGGINGSGMLNSPGLANANPKKDRIWDLVNFMQVLPYLNSRYPAMTKLYDMTLD